MISEKSCVVKTLQGICERFYMKITLTIIPTNLVTNSRLFLLSFCRNQKQESSFQQVGNEKGKTFLFFVYSESRSTSKV